MLAHRPIGPEQRVGDVFAAGVGVFVSDGGPAEAAPFQGTIRLRPIHQNQTGANDVAPAQREVDCEIGPDNPHLSRTTGGATVNVHHWLRCPINVEWAVLGGLLYRDAEYVNSEVRDFRNIPGGDRRDINIAAACVIGQGSHRYTAIMSTTISAAGYKQVSVFESASSAVVDNC